MEGFVFVADLGGSGLRAALVDSQGVTAAVHAEPMPVVMDRMGVCEADPDVWWRAFSRAAGALADLAPLAFANVRAIGVSAFTRTQVFIGADGEVLRPAILWADTRAETIVPELLRCCPPDHPEAPALNAFHPLARLAWVKQEEAGVYARAAAVIEPKDLINLRLTGCIVGDTVSFARLMASAKPGATGGSLLDATNVDPRLLPDLLQPVEIMGKVRAGLLGALARLEDVPVISMANDTWASVLGLGAFRSGTAYNLSGTTEVFGVLDATAASAQGLLSVDWSDGLFQLGGPSLCGGDTLVWLKELLSGPSKPGAGDTLDAFLMPLLGVQRSGSPLLFLPYLQGERVPHWDADLRGAFVGLNRMHGPVDMAFAVLEGIAFLNRLVLERAEAATGHPVHEVRFGGGGSRNAVWCGIKADVMNRPVVTVEGAEHGLSGAAVAAWTALGAYPDLAAAQDAIVKVAARREPDRARHQAYDALYALWCQSDAVLAGISRGLAAVKL